MSALPAVSGLLFDKDGTLLDYWQSWGRINRAAASLAATDDARLAHHLLVIAGYDFESDRVIPDTVLAGGTAAEIASLWAANGSPFEAGELTERLNDLFCASVAEVVPVTDLAALFARLKARGLKLGIASNDGEASIRATVVRFALGPYVDFVVGYDSGSGVKPEGGMVTAFCAAVGLAPIDIAVIGDNVHDMAMATNGGAGLRIGVLTGTGTRETLGPVADLCIDCIDALETVLTLTSVGVSPAAPAD